MPFTFFLLASKLRKSCEDVFRHTKSEAPKRFVNIFPAVVCADFETAIHNAVTVVLPGCEVKACRFHLELVAENTIFGTQQAVWIERL